MKLIIIAASIILLGCNQHPKTINKEDPQVDTCEFIYHSSIDTTEKHFDCTVEDCIEDGGQWYIFTECGICMQSDRKRKIGDVIKGFRSPKHK